MLRQNIIKVIAKNLANLLLRFFTLSSAVCKSRKAGIANSVDFLIYILDVLFLQNSEFFHPIHQPHQSLSHIPPFLLFESSWIPRVPWNIFCISGQHAGHAMKYKYVH